MRVNEVRCRSDRSYLCLIAIYVIHALLLNVFLKSSIDVNINSVILSSNYFRTVSINSNNTSDTIMKSNEYHREIRLSSNFNLSKIAEKRKLDDDVYSVDTSTNAFLQQSQSDSPAIRLLATSKASRVTRITDDVLNSARTIVKNLSPAALGILAGCLVFFLTFTENDSV